MAPSIISVTDVDVFKKLANPTVVNVEDVDASKPRRASEELREAINNAANTIEKSPEIGRAHV